MTTSEQQPRSSVMEGGGAYNRHSQVQSAWIGTAVDLLRRAAELTPLAEAPAPLVIADYGVSQGRNSLAPMGAAIAVFRARAGRERPICVAHNDQPTNDFATLFQLLESDPASYLREDPLVFPSAIGRSFYRRVLPPDSVTLGWSSNATHWLSRVPEIPTDTWTSLATARAEVRAAFFRQADEDWRAFLTWRGAELRPGGRLVVTLIATPDDGARVWAPLRRHLAAEREAMLEEGAVSATEAARMVNPIVPRPRADLIAPFGADNAFAGLAIEHFEIEAAPDPIWDAFQRSNDATAFGARWAAMMRVTIAPSLASALDPARRSVFLDRLEAGLAKRLAAEPEPMGAWHAKIVLVKTAT